MSAIRPIMTAGATSGRIQPLLSGNLNTEAPTFQVQDQPISSPLDQKRELSAGEQSAIQQGLSRTMPAIYPTYSTPIVDMLASPGKNALLNGILGVIVGGISGALAGLPYGKGTGAILGAPLGALIGGGMLGIGSYFERQQHNTNIIDIMKRLAPGATYHDLLIEPAYQQDRLVRAMSHHDSHGGASAAFIGSSLGAAAGSYYGRRLY